MQNSYQQLLFIQQALNLLYICEPYTINIPVEMSSISVRVREYSVPPPKPNICKNCVHLYKQIPHGGKIWFKIKYRRY